MVSPDEVSRYTDYPLSNGASIESTSGGMLVHGLGEVAELEYLYDSTVTDKDGGTDTDDAQAIVVGSGDPLPPPPQIPEPPPLVTCNPAVTLDSQETLFLDLLNAYRVQAGVAPLEASPALTKAALRHALDMAANSFTEHIGSDGSDPIQRALEEGYPIDNVGENLASGLDSAANVLAGWKSSPAHNQNMLDPLWVAIGISLNWIRPLIGLPASARYSTAQRLCSSQRRSRLLYWHPPPLQLMNQVLHRIYQTTL